MAWQASFSRSGVSGCWRRALIAALMVLPPINSPTRTAPGAAYATPEVSRPVRLVQPRVLYRYADPAIESLSAGQKRRLALARLTLERSEW